MASRYTSTPEIENSSTIQSNRIRYAAFDCLPCVRRRRRRAKSARFGNRIFFMANDSVVFYVHELNARNSCAPSRTETNCVTDLCFHRPPPPQSERCYRRQNVDDANGNDQHVASNSKRNFPPYSIRFNFVLWSIRCFSYI